MIDNHQEWQTQVEEKLSDLASDQQSKDLKTIELLETRSTETHSRNDRLEDKLIQLERQMEEQRRQILQLEAIPRMAKQELSTPEKEVPRILFGERGQSSQSHSQNEPPGNSADSKQGQVSSPPQSHSRNDQGGINCAALQETVKRLSFWIMQTKWLRMIARYRLRMTDPEKQKCVKGSEDVRNGEDWEPSPTHPEPQEPQAPQGITEQSEPLGFGTSN